MDEPQTQQAPGAPKGQPEKADSPPASRAFWQRTPVILIGVLAIAGILFLGLGYLADSLTHESTDNAFLDGDIVSIGPKLAGNVNKVYVHENQDVKTGEPLVDLDARDFEVQLAQKKAAQSAAEANTKLIKASFDMLNSQVATANANAGQSKAEANASEANARRAEADLKRAEDLFHKNIMSQQEYDAAKADSDAAAANFVASQQKAISDDSKIAQAKAELEAGFQALQRAEAQTHESQVEVDQADLTLSYAHIIAPQDGKVTRKSVQAGDYVSVGQRLMALVLTDIWVTANFKETQLKRVRVGQPVEVEVDSVAGRIFPAHIQSIQAGSGARFSLLPPENAVGNYVKVVQRVPVKIVFDNGIDAGHVLGPGMSVTPSVKVADYEIPRVATAAVAVVLAVIIGFFWWRAANVKAQS